jgi:hypothetical protein
MFIYAVVMFAVAALGGATLAYMRIVKKDVSMPLAIIHGIFAAAGLVLLILGFMQMGGNGIGAALVIFLLAAIGGFVLFSFHLRSRPLPVPLVVIHGAAAVAAFAVLLLGVFSNTL